MRNGDGVKGYAGGLFWGNPAVGVVSAVGERVDIGSRWANRVGAEAAYYLPSVTVEGGGGWQSGDIRHAGYGKVDLIVRPTNDIAVDIAG